MPAAEVESGVRLRFVDTHGLRLHVAEAGPEDGPLVILLHGFPEFWYGWRHQIPALAAAGFRVWAPDQRGYNLSDKPSPVRAYRLAELVDDVLGLIDAQGRERAALVGHDWGATVAWVAAARAPARVSRLAILNVPHPAVMLRHLRRSLRQLVRSGYIAFFQIPRLPEAMLQARRWGGLSQLLLRSSRPDTFSDVDLRRYRESWSQPGALTAMLHWYRAGFRYGSDLSTLGRVRSRCLMLWGVQDVALGQEMAQPSIEMCDDGRLVFIEEATHWVQHDARARVNAELLAFLRE